MAKESTVKIRRTSRRSMGPANTVIRVLEIV